MSVINCSKLVVSPGDPLRMSSCGYNFGAQCNFSCPTGYRLNGSSSLKCVAQSDSPPGVWDNRLPTCHGTFCRWIYFCSVLLAPSPFPSIRLKHNFFFSLQPLLVHLFQSQNMDKRLDALILYGSLMIPIVVLHAKLATVCLVPLSGGVYKTAHGVELHHHVKVRSLKVHMLKKQDILCPQDELFF